MRIGNYSVNHNGKLTSVLVLFYDYPFVVKKIISKINSNCKSLFKIVRLSNLKPPHLMTGITYSMIALINLKRSVQQQKSDTDVWNLPLCDQSKWNTKCKLWPVMYLLYLNIYIGHIWNCDLWCAFDQGCIVLINIK